MFVEVLLSSDVETSLIDNAGVASSSVMVKVPVESLIVAFEAFDKVMVTVSLGSSVESARTSIEIVFDVSPALNVSVPLVVK